MIKTKLKKITESNQNKVTKQCEAEVAVWKQIEAKDYSTALKDYFDFSVHLLVELADARAKLARLGKK